MLKLLYPNPIAPTPKASPIQVLVHGNRKDWIAQAARMIPVGESIASLVPSPQTSDNTFTQDCGTDTTSMCHRDRHLNPSVADNRQTTTLPHPSIPRLPSQSRLTPDNPSTSPEPLNPMVFDRPKVNESSQAFLAEAHLQAPAKDAHPSQFESTSSSLPCWNCCMAEMLLPS